MQMCQDKDIEVKQREVAMRIINALFFGQQWPTQHACMAGETVFVCSHITERNLKGILLTVLLLGNPILHEEAFRS